LILGQCVDGPVGSCAICQVLTDREAFIRDEFDEFRQMWSAPLCPEHLNRGTVERLFTLQDFYGILWYPDDFDELDRQLREDL
jgi:hypothetical protein